MSNQTEQQMSNQTEQQTAATEPTGLRRHLAVMGVGFRVMGDWLKQQVSRPDMIVPAKKREPKPKEPSKPKQPKQPKPKQAKHIWEMLVVYDWREVAMGRPYTVTMPQCELESHLGNHLRYTRKNTMKKVLYTSGGVLVGVASTLTGGFFWLKSLFLAAVLLSPGWVVFGGMGGMVGMYLAGRFALPPMWLAERSPDGDVAQFDVDGLASKTMRTPQFTREYMKLTPDRNIVAKPNDSKDKLMFGAVIGVVITSVAGLFLMFNVM